MRKQKKLTQKQLAEKLGLDHTTISKWESNTYEPDANNLNKLAEILGVSVDYLLGRDHFEADIFDEEVRSLAREIQNLDYGDRNLLKSIIDSMRRRGKEALEKK